MKNKAILMDRDGTVIKEKPGTYLSDPKGVKLYKNTLKAFKLFKEMGYKLFIVSNQSGIGRGYFGEAEVNAVNQRMCQLLKEAADIDGIYYCPHAPNENCPCRKPAPGLGLKLIKEHNIDVANSFMIGDKKSDIDFAANIGMRGIMVLTANGKRQKAKYAPQLKNVKICLDIYGAAKYIKEISK